MKVSNPGVTVVSRAESVSAENVATVQAPLVFVARAENFEAATIAPMWCRRAEVERLTGIPSTVLARWVSDGVVAVAKLGDAKQSTSVYRLQDVLGAIERKATSGGAA